MRRTIVITLAVLTSALRDHEGRPEDDDRQAGEAARDEVRELRGGLQVARDPVVAEADDEQADRDDRECEAAAEATGREAGTGLGGRHCGTSRTVVHRGFDVDRRVPAQCARRPRRARR